MSLITPLLIFAVISILMLYLCSVYPILFTNIISISLPPQIASRTPGKDPPKMAVVKEQTYEESMGMDTGADDDDIMEIERLDAVTCYFSHDWSADEMQRYASTTGYHAITLPLTGAVTVMIVCT